MNSRQEEPGSRLGSRSDLQIHDPRVPLHVGLEGSPVLLKFLQRLCCVLGHTFLQHFLSFQIKPSGSSHCRCQGGSAARFAVIITGFRCQQKPQGSGGDVCRRCRELVLMSPTPALFCLLLTPLIAAGKGLSQQLLEDVKELVGSALERCLHCSNASCMWRLQRFGIRCACGGWCSAAWLVSHIFSIAHIPLVSVWRRHGAGSCCCLQVGRVHRSPKTLSSSGFVGQIHCAEEVN